jgi:hypothetical protein
LSPSSMLSFWFDTEIHIVFFNISHYKTKTKPSIIENMEDNFKFVCRLAPCVFGEFLSTWKHETQSLDKKDVCLFSCLSYIYLLIHYFNLWNYSISLPLVLFCFVFWAERKNVDETQETKRRILFFKIQTMHTTSLVYWHSQFLSCVWFYWSRNKNQHLFCVLNAFNFVWNIFVWKQRMHTRLPNFWKNARYDLSLLFCLYFAMITNNDDNSFLFEWII